MIISDAHIHIWSANTPERPWRPGSVPPGGRATPFEPQEIVSEMDRAGVHRAVLIPPTLVDGNNEFALKAVADYPGRFGVMGNLASLQDPKAVDIASWRDQPGMLGIRLKMGSGKEDVNQLRDGSTDWLFTAASDHQVPIMMIAPGLSPVIGDIAKRYPNARIIIDHMNIDPPSGNKSGTPNIDDLLALSDIPNVAIKVSGLPCHVSEAFPFPSLHPLIKRAIGAFGADRCMWGSDCSRLSCPYGEWVRAITEGAFLSSDEIELLMGSTLATWLKWPTVPDTS